MVCLGVGSFGFLKTIIDGVVGHVSYGSKVRLSELVGFSVEV